MRSSLPEVLPPDLAQAQARFERWRRERRGQTRIPLELWNAATALVPVHGATRVSTVLRLSFADLKRRAAVEPAASSRSASGPPSVSFVAFPPGLALGQTPREACIELAHPSGATLRVSLPDSAVDLPALLAAFLRGAS